MGILRSPLAGEEKTRIGVVKILVSLLPGSWNLMDRWLKARGDSQAYEIQFTMFCFLDNVPDMSLPEAATSQILDSLADYLKTINTEAAHAAWMVGDLLGDHWCTPETFTVLLEAVQDARFVAGRSAALSGIEKALARAPRGGSSVERAVKVLETVSQSDRSRRIRAGARNLLTRGEFRTLAGD
jgi:hypothetical protein